MDEWADAWLSAHMVQHELLIVVAAPLIAAAAPLCAVAWALPARWRRRVGAVAHGRAGTATAVVAWPAVAWLLQAIALWAWHVPALYDLAVRNETVHALEHLSFFGTALLFWWAIARGRYGKLGYGAGVVYIFATAVQGSLLGALLTFAPRAWFAAYAQPHGGRLSPLEDQQLAGLLMWVPAGLVLAASGLAFFAFWIRESERRADTIFKAMTS
jgi:putative membrane protein